MVKGNLGDVERSGISKILIHKMNSQNENGQLQTVMSVEMHPKKLSAIYPVWLSPRIIEWILKCGFSE